MIFNINVERVQGLTTQEKNMLIELLNVHQKHLSGNVRKEKYYEGDIPLSEVNLGIALPKAFRGLEISCPWGAKTVDELAARLGTPVRAVENDGYDLVAAILGVSAEDIL